MIVMPMAGLSSRFTKAGYTLPKYMLKAFDKPLFDYAVESFQAYFQQEDFLFICRDIHDTEAFINARCSALGIKSYQISTLTAPTEGQAETVALGLKQAQTHDTAITVFNIDTFRRNFTFPSFINDCDGYLEVFEGTGSNWSYAKPESDKSNRVIETAEKNPISNLCSTGLYHFKKASNFLAAFEEAMSNKGGLVNNEYYIAPLYNTLIKKGLDIRYDLVPFEDITFCGVPEEYDAFLSSAPKKSN
jgi:NDP-sugar pyrophosphorylase family protein